MPGKGSRAPSGPWSRLKPIEQDPLEAFGLPSKGDNRLLDARTQEKYYTKIVERYMSFCSEAGQRDEILKAFAAMECKDGDFNPNIRERELADSGGRDTESLQSSMWAKDQGKGQETVNSTSKSAKAAKAKPKDVLTPFPDFLEVPADTRALSQVMMALRKLREGIVASKRADDFTLQAYMFNIRLSVLVKHPESYHPAILYLLRKLHTSVTLTSLEMTEIVGYLVLDTACRRKELAEAFHLQHKYRLKDKHVSAVLKALIHDNYVQFRRLRRDVDGHKARLMDWAEDDIRLATLKCIGKTYLDVGREFLEKMTGKSWDELIKNDSVGWEAHEGKIIIRRVKR